MHYHLSSRFFYFCFILLALPDSKIDTPKKSVHIQLFRERLADKCARDNPER